MRNRFTYNLGLLSNKLRTFPRVMNNYISLAAGRYRLRSVEVDLGYRCQLKCDHCYASDLIKKEEKAMPLSNIKIAIDQCVNQGAIHFLISGGEPLIYPQVFDIISHINKRAAFSCAVTNGVALDSRMIERLAHAKLDILEISLDSADPSTHDNNRKKQGLHAHVQKMASLCKKKGIEVFYSTVITNENLTSRDIEDVIALARKQGIRNHFCFPVSTGSWKEKDMRLSEENMAKALALFKEHDIRCCEEGNYGRKGCSAGIEKICINPYGEVLPCPYIQASFGNLKKEELRTILARMRAHYFFKKIDGHCMPSFNKAFIEEFMKRIHQSEELPYKVYK